MWLGVMKVSPLVAVLAALSAKDALAYAGIVSMLSAILVVGALWGAAKAWRERAEARSDEADQLAGKAIETARQIADLTHKFVEVKAELKARPDLRAGIKEMRDEHAALRAADAEEHRAIVASLERLSCSIQESLGANTTAIEALAKHVPWAELLGDKPKEQT